MKALSFYRMTLIALILLSSNMSFGQEEGEIIISEDPRVDSLIRAQPRPYNDMIKGYRVILTTEKKKVKINESRKRFIALYPSVPTYVVYHAPNYILKAGDFQHKNDAQKLQVQLKKFPYSFIKEELVHYNLK